MSRPLVIGHRGSSLRHAENTIAAFSGALAEGADGVELDVRRAADDALAVHHDEALPDGREIAVLGRAELPAGVPELAAVLDACAGALVNIEIKSAGTPGEVRLADDVVALVHERAGDDVLISSFDPQVLDRVRELDPVVRRAFLSVSIAPETLRARAAAGDVAVHPHERSVDAGLVETAHGLGLRVHAWTVNDPDRIRRLAGLGVDAVITDDPTGALAALGPRPG
ncbi:MAG: glycerophosphodiester phosphodiesterase [Mycobacteriales bacterium]